MKVVIIGSGLGGLACGVILAKNGYKVSVLEQEAQIGGCLQSFIRHKVNFETGMHFIGSALPEQSLGRMLRYLEIEQEIRLSALDRLAYNVICIDGFRYNFANGRETFIQQMATYFPNQRLNLEKYFDILEMIEKASLIHRLNNDNSNSAINMVYHQTSVNEVISSIITDPLLQKVLVGILPLYAGEKNKTPFSTHAFVMDFYNQSAFRVIGGSGTIAEALKKTIERYGGSVDTHCKVTAVQCDETHATSVVVNDTNEIFADYIISDIHPQRTLELLNTKLIRPAFKHRIMGLQNTVSAFTVYLEFKQETMPYMNSNFFGYRYGTPWDCEKYSAETWPHGYLYMHMCHENGAHYAKSGEIISYMWMDDVQQWQGTKCGHRGKEYEDFKKAKAEKLIDCVEMDFPGFRNTIKCYHTSSPLTYYDYIGTSNGSMYGIAKDINKGALCRVPHRTKVSNLLFTGQNINSHGMQGVLVGAIVTCSELLTYNTIYSQILKDKK